MTIPRRRALAEQGQLPFLRGVAHEMVDSEDARRRDDIADMEAIYEGAAESRRGKLVPARKRPAPGPRPGSAA